MDNPGLSGYLIYVTPDNNWQFWIGNGGSSWVTLVGTQVELNTWTHIGATYDGSAMHFYINGTEVGNPVTANFVPNTTSALFIGAGDTQANPNYFFCGELSQVGLWNVAYSAAQIQVTMSQQLQGNEAGLVGYWSLTQSSGSIAYDHTNGQYHGTIIGAANWVTTPDLVVAGAGGSGATSTQTQTLWQIGKPGGRGKEFVKAGGWQAEFTYIVGSDADSINRPHMPPVLVVPERKQKPNLYSTNKLNIRFTLERDYGIGELTLFYDFFGSEKDTLSVNGQKLTEILGAGEAKLKQNQIPLPALGKGEHTLTFTTTGGGPDKLHWIDYLKLEAVITVTQGMMHLGPVGSDIEATDFEIKPRQDALQSRIKRLMVNSYWGIDALQVEYENHTTQPPSLYQSIKVGGNGGAYKEWSINNGDYITKVSGTWGRQGPKNPQHDINTLQFHTHKGTSSPIFGGENTRKEVESFEFIAPEGYEIIGFFGAASTRLLVRLGVYLRPILAITQPGKGADSLLPTGSQGTSTQSETQTLWQIGKPGNRADEFPKGKGFVPEFTYTIGSDADSINHPNMPPVLVIPGSVPNPKRYSTYKLNVSFNLERDYGKDELTLYYDFFGSETDTILINGQNLIQIKGTGESKIKKNQIPLPALVKGNHILTFTTAGGTRKGAWKDAHLIDYLKLEVVTSVTQGMMHLGPVGSDIEATDFEIKPRQDALQSRIKRLMVNSYWGIDALQVEYENHTTQPPSLYQSIKVGGNGGAYKEWSINNGDYITKVSGTWGRQGPKNPQHDINTLQFHTHKGTSSPIFGGENPNKEVEPFEFIAPEGYEIIGFFGATSTRLLVRLGVYLRPILAITQPGEGADSLLTTGSQGTSTQSGTEILWQIGKPGDRADEFPTGKGFVPEFTYTIGSDADSINHPNMPPVLVIPGSVPNPKRYSTYKLNVSFNLERDYGKDELTLFYDFFGSETDTILINGQNLIQIKGTGESKIKKNQIPLPALVKGNHILTFTTAGGTHKGAWKDAHLIDYLKLEAVVTTTQPVQGVTKPLYVGSGGLLLRAVLVRKYRRQILSMEKLLL